MFAPRCGERPGMDPGGGQADQTHLSLIASLSVGGTGPKFGSCVLKYGTPTQSEQTGSRTCSLSQIRYRRGKALHSVARIPNIAGLGGNADADTRKRFAGFPEIVPDQHH